jgi:hypothetical protein
MVPGATTSMFAIIPLIGVLHDVAVVDELPDDHRVRERDDDLHGAGPPLRLEREAHGVLVAGERLRHPVDLHHLEVGLVDVEDVQLACGCVSARRVVP